MKEEAEMPQAIRSRWKAEYWALVFSGILAIGSLGGSIMSYMGKAAQMDTQEDLITELRQDMKPIPAQMSALAERIDQSCKRLDSIDRRLLFLEARITDRNAIVE